MPVSKQRKAIRPIRFRAALPVMLPRTSYTRRIAKKKWEALPEHARDARRYSWTRGARTDYLEIVPVPERPNPVINKIRGKLERHRIAFFEWVEPVDGVPHVHFSTLPEDKIV